MTSGIGNKMRTQFPLLSSMPADKFLSDVSVRFIRQRCPLLRNKETFDKPTFNVSPIKSKMGTVLIVDVDHLYQSSWIVQWKPCNDIPT